MTQESGSRANTIPRDRLTGLRTFSTLTTCKAAKTSLTPHFREEGILSTPLPHMMPGLVAASPWLRSKPPSKNRRLKMALLLRPTSSDNISRTSVTFIASPIDTILGRPKARDQAPTTTRVDSRAVSVCYNQHVLPAETYQVRHCPHPPRRYRLALWQTLCLHHTCPLQLQAIEATLDPDPALRPAQSNTFMVLQCQEAEQTDDLADGHLPCKSQFIPFPYLCHQCIYISAYTWEMSLAGEGF